MLELLIGALENRQTFAEFVVYAGWETVKCLSKELEGDYLKAFNSYACLKRIRHAYAKHWIGYAYLDNPDHLCVDVFWEDGSTNLQCPGHLEEV